jgi:hypothetical protein
MRHPLSGVLVIRLLMVEDDERRVVRVQEWLPTCVRLVWARSAGMAIGMLNRDKGRVYGGIMLDHDLFQQRVTQRDGLHNGKHVAEAVIRNVDTDVPVFVHSTNVSEGPRMAEMLEGAGFAVDIMPFHSLKQDVFDEWMEYVCEAA